MSNDTKAVVMFCPLTQKFGCVLPVDTKVFVVFTQLTQKETFRPLTQN